MHSQIELAGDGKKAEQVVREHARCGGAMLSFFEARVGEGLDVTAFDYLGIRLWWECRWIVHMVSLS